MDVRSVWVIICLSLCWGIRSDMPASAASNSSDQVLPSTLTAGQELVSSYGRSILPSDILDSSTASSSCANYDSYSCPFWSYCDEEDRTCRCYNNADYIFICDGAGNRDFILDCLCLTYSSDRNTTYLGICLYNCDYDGKGTQDVDLAYVALPRDVEDLDTFICSRYNRSSTLCGECLPGMYIRPYSYNLSCVTCSNSWSNLFKYVLQAYVPLTAFYLTILMLKINIPNSSILGYVFFCQILASPIFLRTMLFYLNEETDKITFKLVQFFCTLYGIWNLDFFRTVNLNVCFPISPLAIFALDFAIAVYPLLLMLITYALIVAYDSNFKLVRFMLKPFKALPGIFRSSWDIKTSTIDAFSTFIFLSNSKFLSVCFDLLTYVQVCETSEQGECHFALFYDASIAYFGPQHLPYGILAILILLIFVVCPILILALFPLRFFHKCLTVLPGRWLIGLHVFVDSYQGCFKDGTQPGTTDFRWFSAVPFVVRLMIFFIYGATKLSSFYPLCEIVLVLTATLTIVLDPFKPAFKDSSFHFVVYIVFLASVIVCNRGLQNTVVITAVFYAVIITILTINLVYISVVIFRWILSHKKFDLKSLCDFFRHN